MSLTEHNGTARWQNRPVRRPRNRNKAKKTPLFLFLVGGFLFVGLLCVYCWQKAEMRNYGYLMEVEKQRIIELEEKYRQLKLEEAYLLTPARINQLAYDRLGMTTPSPDQVIFDTDSFVENPGTMVMSASNAALKPEAPDHF